MWNWFALAVDGIIHTSPKLTVGGAVEWKSYFQNTDFRITGNNSYLITSILLVNVKGVMSLWAETRNLLSRRFVCNVFVLCIVNN
jgi:hypothetical protein